jgi:hypothetical protein
MPENVTQVAGTTGPITKPAPLQRSNASKRKANPRDLTGVRKQQLEAERAEEQLQAAAQMSLASEQAAARRRDEVVDYSQGGLSAPGMPLGVEEPEPEVTEVQEPFVTIRVNAPIEDMVFGREVIEDAEFNEKGELLKEPVLGSLQFYNFEEGVSYLVPRAIAEHLERIQYVYH